MAQRFSAAITGLFSVTALAAEVTDATFSAAQQRSRLLAAKYHSDMALDELRQAREMTQVHLARILGVNQAAVSKLERRADMYVSTLQNFVKAMGGELKITAKFPEGTVEISQFEDVKEAAAGKQ